MIKHPTHCKFCQARLVLDIDPEYQTIGDYLNLLPLACCDRCNDLRVRRRTIEESIFRIVAWLIANPNSEKVNIAQALTKLTKAYTSLVADWLRATSPWWDGEIVSAIIETPRGTGKILAQCWKMYKNRAQ